MLSTLKFQSFSMPYLFIFTRVGKKREHSLNFSYEKMEMLKGHVEIHCQVTSYL